MERRPPLPQVGTRFQVIGAGLPRTGNASLTLALQTLLAGPVYHCGTHIAYSDTSNIKRWTEILSHIPTQDSHDRQYIMTHLQEMLTGYVACTDSPAAQFTEELVQIYPEAKVICTVRDPAEWIESMQSVALSPGGFMGWVFWPLPTLRYLASYLGAFRRGRWSELYNPYGTANPYHTRIEQWDYHMDYLKHVVPQERLFYFDVRYGWEPLCEILQCDVPKQKFPWVNHRSSVLDKVEVEYKNRILTWFITCSCIAATVGFGFGLGIGTWRRR